MLRLAAQGEGTANHAGKILQRKFARNAKLIFTRCTMYRIETFLRRTTATGSRGMSPRNFGIPKVSTRAAVGGNQPRGPQTDANSTRVDNVIPFQLATALTPDAAWLNSDDFHRQLFIENEQPVIEPYELGSGLLFLFVVLLPWVIVGGLVIGYLAFIA